MKKYLKLYFLKLKKDSVKITLKYIAFSIIWIIFSDSAIGIFNFDKTLSLSIAKIKGSIFVIVTGLMLYFLIEKSIKALKLSEEKSKKKEEMYRLVIDGTTDGVWEFDIKNNYVYISPMSKGKIGYKDEEIENSIEGWQGLLHPEDNERTLQQLKKYINKEIPQYDCEFRARMKSGQYIWVQSRGQGIWNEAEEIIRVIGTCTEITGRKLMEEELKKSNEENVKLLNEAIAYDKLKIDFFINISHEFRTPLNVLLGTVQLMESYYLTRDSHKLKKHIKVMKQNCYMLIRLTNNLLDSAQIESCYMKVNLENRNIVEIAEEVTSSVKEFIENKSITLNFDTDIEEKIVSCDINMIERIILNLISNAIKFNKTGGSIAVEIKDMNDSVIITVKDTGIGIPDDKINVIFERFRQVDSSLIRENEGSGIGLSIVKSLVQMHGGEIWVESKIGKGSEFKVKLLAIVQCDDLDIPIETEVNRNYSYITSIEFSDIYFN